VRLVGVDTQASADAHGRWRLRGVQQRGGMSEGSGGVWSGRLGLLSERDGYMVEEDFGVLAGGCASRRRGNQRRRKALGRVLCRPWFFPHFSPPVKAGECFRLVRPPQGVNQKLYVRICVTQFRPSVFARLREARLASSRPYPSQIATRLFHQCVEVAGRHTARLGGCSRHLSNTSACDPEWTTGEPRDGGCIGQERGQIARERG
jgi:hypothetical protein